MFDLFQVALRYFFMIVFGALSVKGVYDESLVEPLVGFSVAVSACVWYYLSKIRTLKAEEEKENDE